MIDKHQQSEPSLLSESGKPKVECNPSCTTDQASNANECLSPATIPLSPSQKLVHLVSSPVRLVKRQVSPGSVNASVFALIIICMGAGTITIPYVFYENGLILGTLFVFFGASLSIYTGFLIAFCAERTGGASFEEIAYHLYGTRGMRFTSFCNICCNIGFLISYVVLFKDLTPYALNLFGATLPSYLDDSKLGKTVWATLFCFLALLPLSLPRELTALRFTSLISFGISLFMVMTIFLLSFRETEADGFQKHDFSERWHTAATQTKVSLAGIFNSLPLIIFSYMYHPNIPAIYHELKKKNMISMKKVLGIGTGLATVAYFLVGIFGYVTFSMNPNCDEIMDEQNILKADYGDLTIIKVCLVGVLIVVLFASPFCVLPSKDAIEELIMKDR